MLFLAPLGGVPQVSPSYPSVSPQIPVQQPAAPWPPVGPRSWATNILIQPKGAAVTSPINTSSGASNDYNDRWGGAGVVTGQTPPTAQPDPVAPVVTAPSFAAEPEPSRIIALSPIGFVAGGIVLVGLWAALRKR